MQYRKDSLENDNYYHVFSRSIAGYSVFNDGKDFRRISELIDLYRYSDFNYKYSAFCDLTKENQKYVLDNLRSNNDVIVEIVAFCLMPTHIHLVLKQINDDGISKYMARVLNGYSRYFNNKHKRQGPLWAGRFKSVLVENDIQLLHLTRYIHLNPSSASLVANPMDWDYSSYHNYISPGVENSICNFIGLFDFSPEQYKKFVNDRKSYQRDLSIIKNILIDDYSG